MSTADRSTVDDDIAKRQINSNQDSLI